MPRISLFAEDYGHEVFLNSLLKRLADEHGLNVTTRPFSVRGGYGTVLAELDEYVADLLQYKAALPDLILVATDANCQGFSDRRRLFQRAVEPIRHQTVLAIPDPHIERWLLLDAAAFKAAVGTGCPAPDLKCGRNRYKSLLAQAVVHSGASPLLGGLEYAEEIVSRMDLGRLQTQDESLGNLLQELYSRFRIWRDQASALPD